MCPGELIVEEGEYFSYGCPPEEHRAAEFVPRLDLTAHVAGSERVPTASLQGDELRVSVARGQLGQANELPGIREVCVTAD